MDGVQEQDRLRGEGVRLDLDSAELAALGRAMAEQREALAPAQAQDLTLTEEQVQALDMVVAERAAVPEHWRWDRQRELHQHHRHAANESCNEDGPGPAPDRTAKSTAEDPDNGDGSGKEYGRDDHTTHQVGEISESDERRKRYWADLTRDRPDEEWR